ncbi:MAG: hypothetical protein ACK518_01235 [bacterium]
MATSDDPSCLVYLIILRFAYLAEVLEAGSLANYVMMHAGSTSRFKAVYCSLLTANLQRETRGFYTPSERRSQ